MDRQSEANRMYKNYTLLKQADPDNEILKYFPSKTIKNGKIKKVILKPNLEGLINFYGIRPEKNTTTSLCKYCADILNEELFFKEEENRLYEIDEKIHKLLLLEPENPIKEFCRFSELGILENVLEVGDSWGDLFQYLEILGKNIPPLGDYKRIKLKEEEFLEALNYLLKNAQSK